MRRLMRARRKALTKEERERANAAICARLGIAADSSGASGPIAVYLASADEIDISDFIREALKRGVQVVAPRWNGETYELARLRGLAESDLRTGPMKIPEPAEAEIVHPSKVSTWIVPGLAFTKDGRRLGYGGGWYDRLLALSSGNSLKIGVAHEFQIADDLPHEPHDVRLDRIVTTA